MMLCNSYPNLIFPSPLVPQCNICHLKSNNNNKNKPPLPIQCSSLLARCPPMTSANKSYCFISPPTPNKHLPNVYSSPCPIMYYNYPSAPNHS